MIKPSSSRCRLGLVNKPVSHGNEHVSHALHLSPEITGVRILLGRERCSSTARRHVFYSCEYNIEQNDGSFKNLHIAIRLRLEV